MMVDSLELKKRVTISNKLFVLGGQTNRFLLRCSKHVEDFLSNVVKFNLKFEGLLEVLTEGEVDS